MESTSNDTTNATIKPSGILKTLYGDTEILMSTCVVEYSLIGAAIMLVLWVSIGRSDSGRATPFDQHRKQQVRVDCSASSTGLFAGLLYLLIAIVGMGLFDAKTHIASSFTGWSIDVVLLTSALIACVVAMWRMRRLSYASGHHGTVEMLDEILLIIGLIGEVVFCSIMLLEFFPTTPPAPSVPEYSPRDQIMLFMLNLFRLVQVLVQALLILFSTKLVAAGRSMQDKPGKQFITFLLIANAVLFVLHSYKTQRETVDGVSLFANSQSLTVLKAVNPLVIFFRFHSSICLADLWKHAYNVKDFSVHDNSVMEHSSNDYRHSCTRERANSVTIW